MAIHSSILAWKSPWTEEPGGLQSMESHGFSLVVLSMSVSEDDSHLGLGPTCKTSFNPGHLFKDPISKYSHVLRFWELGLQLSNLWRDTVQP